MGVESLNCLNMPFRMRGGRSPIKGKSLSAASAQGPGRIEQIPHLCHSGCFGSLQTRNPHWSSPPHTPVLRSN